jgi:hypothetical protein
MEAYTFYTLNIIFQLVSMFYYSYPILYPTIMHVVMVSLLILIYRPSWCLLVGFVVPLLRGRGKGALSEVGGSLLRCGML